ncbi:MAG: hypothetical protein JETT_2622 [Candidatus Jettenia ecosi]|uniref:Uncharacterized protein n=1 Tax=Candidatus Jettenia ecosi TaxID=2494326 RepID=A0A533QEI8_9BACT|nr:MAG: hypothetical protein JETT_2622 [Candidatus Jettenia ecosi]
MVKIDQHTGKHLLYKTIPGQPVKGYPATSNLLVLQTKKAIAV